MLGDTSLPGQWNMIGKSSMLSFVDGVRSHWKVFYRVCGHWRVWVLRVHREGTGLISALDLHWTVELLMNRIVDALRKASRRSWDKASRSSFVVGGLDEVFHWILEVWRDVRFELSFGFLLFRFLFWKLFWKLLFLLFFLGLNINFMLNLFFLKGIIRFFMEKIKFLFSLFFLNFRIISLYLELPSWLLFQLFDTFVAFSLSFDCFFASFLLFEISVL